MTSTETDSKLSNIIEKLKIQIDGLNIIFETVRDVILELAKYLDENKYCETSEICSFIKKLLEDKIRETKITARWIEECLPKEYKRNYGNGKSELTSQSTTRKITQTSAGQQIVQDVQGNQSISGSDGNKNDKEVDENALSNIDIETRDLQQENAELKEALLRAETFRNALNLKHKFEIGKDKLSEIIERLKNCAEKCYLIFNEQGALIRIEADTMGCGNENEQ
jgi:hypothetical protein